MKNKELNIWLNDLIDSANHSEGKNKSNKDFSKAFNDIPTKRDLNQLKSNKKKLVVFLSQENFEKIKLIESIILKETNIKGQLNSSLVNLLIAKSFNDME